MRGARPSSGTPPASTKKTTGPVACTTRITLGLLGAIATLACIDGGQSRRIDVPDAITWLGQVSIEQQNGASRGSALHPKAESPNIVTAHRSGIRTFVVGYEDRTIAAIGPDAGEKAQSAPLRPAEKCETSFPAPDWTFAILEDGSFSETTPPPALTADWLLEECPSIHDETPPHPGFVANTSVESGCGFCSIDTFAQFGCRVVFAQRECAGFGPETREGRVSYGGEICWLDDGCEARPPDRANASFFCADEVTQCTIHVHRQAWTEDDRWASWELLRLFDPLPTVEPFTAIPVSAPKLSQLSDVTAMGDEVVVTGHATVAVGQDCGGVEPTQLFFLDGARLEGAKLVRTATAPPCLTRIIEDPGGDGLLGVYTVNRSEMYIARFDRNGRRGATRAVPVPVRATPPSAQPWPVDLFHWPQHDQLIVVVGASGNGPVWGEAIVATDHQIVALDPVTFETKWTQIPNIPGPVEIPLAALDTAANRLVLSDLRTDSFYAYDGTRAEREILSANEVSSGTRNLALAASDGSFVAGFVRVNELAIARQGARFWDESARLHDPIAEALLIAPKPGDWWVASRPQVYASEDVHLARLDIERGRVRPGTLDIKGANGEPPGLPARYTWDRSGRLWMTFRRSGYVAIVTPVD